MFYTSSGVVGDQRPETAEEAGAQRTWTSRYPTTSGFEDERRVKGRKDEEGVNGGGEEAEVEEDRVCGHCSRGCAS